MIPAGETTATLTVILELGDDDIDQENGFFFIAGAHTSPKPLAVFPTEHFTIVNNDTRGIDFSTRTIELTEGDVGEEYGVVLTSEPTESVTVMLDITGAEGVAISIDGQSPPSAELTFTADNWNSTQVLTVSADDNDHIQQRMTVVTIEHIASGGDYVNVTASVEVTVTDNELTQAQVTVGMFHEVSGQLVPLQELSEGAGEVTVFVVAETTIPFYRDLPIALGLTYPDDVRPSSFSGEVVISADQYSGTVTFMLTPTDDDIAEDIETILLTSGPLEDEILSEFIAEGSFENAVLEIIDNDIRGVIVTPSPVTVAEGSSGVYSVRLNSQPDGGDVQVEITGVARAAEDEGKGRTLTFSLGGEPRITSAADGTFTPIDGGVVLTFTADNWSAEQMVSVELSANDVPQEVSIATIMHSVSGGDYGAETVTDVVLNLTEFGFIVSGPTPADVLEGESVEYGIRLTSQPEQDVVMEVRLPEDPDIMLTSSPTSLTFTGMNWETEQTVSVTYGDDELSTGNQTLAVTHVAVSVDPNYESNGATVAAVSLNFIDDEALPVLRLELSQLEALEGGTAADGTTDGMSTHSIELTVTAFLDGPARSGETIVHLSLGAVGDTADGGDYSTNLPLTASLSIPKEATESNGSTFTLTLFQDRIDEGVSEIFTLRAVPDGDMLVETSAVFTIIDDDSAGITATPLEPRRLRKGQDTEYVVVLTSEPTGDVMLSVEAVEVSDSDVQLVDVSVSIAGEPPPFRFTPANWFQPQTVTVTAVDLFDDNPRFGNVDIVFSVASADDPNYSGTFVETGLLEIVDIDATLSRLELMITGGEGISFDMDFSPDDLEYSATIPFGVNEVTIRAVPNVTQTLGTEGEGDQNPGEVRIVGTDHPRSMGDPGAEHSVDLDLTGRDDFIFFVEVSVSPTVAADLPVIETYTLTLTRALPATAELLAYRDGDRQNPLNDDDTLIFGPEDDEMVLVFVLADLTNNSYSISDLMLLGFDDIVATITVTSSDDLSSREFRVAVGEEVTETLETRVTLSRAEVRGEDFEFSLTFEAEPARPIAADADALSAEIEVSLEDNTLTNTEISVTYQGHSQSQVETVTFSADEENEIMVSDNGIVTIFLEVIYESGGNRTFEQGDFTFAVDLAPDDDPNLRVTLAGGILVIDPAGEVDVSVTVSVAADDGLIERGFNDSTAPRTFNVKFVHPTANIQPQPFPEAELDPVREFTDPLFVFVNEVKTLSLEVVLAEDSTPLTGGPSDDEGILRNLPLTLTAPTAEETVGTVSITVGDGESDLPGRILLFEVTEARNNVMVEVDVEDQEQNPSVTVADSFSFRAHFLSLEHADEIQFSEVVVSEDFVPDNEVIEVSLRGEDAENEGWTLRAINTLQLGDDYSVEEVIVVPESRVYEIARKIVTTTTLNGGVQTTTIYMLGTETLSLLNEEIIEAPIFENVDSETLRAEVREFLSASLLSSETRTLVATIEGEVYRPLNEDEMGLDRGVTRFLRITRLLPDAENSRVVLEFDYSYSLDGENSEGFFYRTIDINTGLVAELRGAVTPDTVVVPKGGTARVTLEVGNLKLGEDRAGSITFNADADVTVVAVDDAVLDSINRRFEQTLRVTVAEDAAESSYDVVVEVSLRGRVFKTEFTVDVNDPPEYKGEGEDGKPLMVYESHVSEEEPRSKTFALRIVDPDGGLQTLKASELMLEVVDFAFDMPVAGIDYTDNRLLHSERGCRRAWRGNQQQRQQQRQQQQQQQFPGRGADLGRQTGDALRQRRRVAPVRCDRWL